MNEQDYQEPPEVKTDSIENGLFCFLDSSRECGSDCMAFVTEPPQDPQLLNVQQKNCVLLISAERLGRYSAGISTALNKGEQRRSKEAADRQRGAATQPPNPLGNK